MSDKNPPKIESEEEILADDKRYLDNVVDKTAKLPKKPNENATLQEKKAYSDQQEKIRADIINQVRKNSKMKVEFVFRFK